MTNIVFELNPDKNSIIESFPMSPYFSEEAFGHRENGIALGTDIIAATIWSRVVGVLAWSLLWRKNGTTLKIELVEVVEEYRSKPLEVDWVYQNLHIGRKLIHQVEMMNVWEFDLERSSLNSPFNAASIRMFQSIGFHRVGAYFLEKDASKYWNNSFFLQQYKSIFRSR